MAAARVNLGAIDLNLLVVFDAVMRERNVTRAGQRVGLSQPAMSYALVRLRHMLKDELFVRSPKGMLPTPRAEQIALPIRQALDNLQHSLEPAEFNPSEAQRTFRIAADSYAAMVLVPPAAIRLAKAAPNVTLAFRPSGTLDIPDLLDRGQLELAIGSFAHKGERFSRRQLLEDTFVAVLRKSHPVGTTDRKLTLEQFAALPHLEVSSPLPQATNFIDDTLSREESQSPDYNACTVPFSGADFGGVRSYFSAAAARRTRTDQLSSSVIRHLPHASPRIETAMIWPRWFDNQPAHRWLRQTIEAAVRDLPR